MNHVLKDIRHMHSSHTPGRGDAWCKGPGAGKDLECPRKENEVLVFGCRK